MKPQMLSGPSAVGLALSLCMTALSLMPTKAIAQQPFVIKPVAEKKLAQLPPGSLYWQVENFPTIALARAAEGPTSLAVEAGGKAWLMVLGPKGGSLPGATKMAEIGPIPPITAQEYMLRITQSGGPPGAKTPVHSHPGAEAFFVLTGRMGQKTPHGTTYTETGGSLNGHAGDMPMEVFSAGTTDLDQLVLFVVDAARPFTVPAKFE